MSQISVVLPVYNCEKYVGNAIESILTQTISVDQILVINDGSTDNTPQIVSAFPQVTLLNQNNKGISEALNAGISAAKGKYLTFLDADDLWEPNKLALQLDYLSQHDTVDLVFSKIQQFVSPDLSEEQQKKYECPVEAMEGIHRSALFAKADTIRMVGPFSSDYTSAEFLDWYVRAREKGIKSHVLNATLVRRRIHGNNLTLQAEIKQKPAFPKILKMALDRRRTLDENN